MLQLTKPGQPHQLSAPPIEAVGVSAGYNGERAIENISFCLEPGSRVAVVGPNGAGKTTLFKVIAGILPLSRGRIEVHGHEPGQHLCVAYLPQRSEVDWDFPVSVSDVVMMGRIREIGLFQWPRRADWKRVREALDQVDMAWAADRQIGDLSGGQQQRVFLAQAVAQEAEILLLDEPLSGLDRPSQEGILDILDRLRQSGVTVLIATHDLNLAAEHFAEVMLLNKIMISMGKPREALSRDSLLKAYGGGLHFIDDQDGSVMADVHRHGWDH
ncbi:MAG: metal ABC transporter ATP-binding protein [Anaerolineales bacterium]